MAIAANKIKKAILLLILPIQLNWVSGSKELTWDDFKGTPKPDHTAYVSMSIGFEYTDLQDGHYIFEDAAVTIHPESSYSNSRDPYILNHENGHLKIAWIQCNYINNLSHIHHIHYTKAQFEVMKNEIIRRWNVADEKYDRETNNSINRNAQASWDLWIAKQLILNK